MTDRIHALTVVLDKDMRDDDAEGLIKAIGRFRGVLHVDTHVSDIALHTAEMRTRHELGMKLINVVYPEKGGKE